MEQTVNPGTEARAEGAATLTQADLDRVVQQTIARERRRAEAALEAARAEAGRAERERLEAGMAQRERDVARRELAAQKAGRLEDVFLATVNAQNQLTVFERTGRQIKREFFE